MNLFGFIVHLFRLAKPSPASFSSLVGLVFLEALTAVPRPLLFAWLIAMLIDGLTGQHIALFLAAMLGLQIVGAGLRIVRVRINRRFAMRAANRLRGRFFEHLVHLPYAWFLENQAGGQANSYLNDIDDIDKATSGLVDNGIASLLILLVMGTTILIWNPVIAAVAFVMVPVTVWAQRSLRSRVRSSSREKVALREEMTGTVAEAVGHINVVKAFALEDHIHAKASRYSAAFSDTEVVMETQQSALRSSSSVLLIFTQYAFFVVGACLVVADQLSLPNFLGQMVLLGQLTAPTNALLNYGNELVRCQAALGRVQEIIDRTREDAGDAERAELPASTGAGLSLAARELRFRFDPRIPLIDGWTFDLQPGQTLAVVGPSGSGKTTLFNLLLGLHQGYQGELLLAGEDCRHWTLQSLRRQVGVVFQEQQLFNASIRDNLLIACGEHHHPSDAELWDVLAMAHAKDFVSELADGLDTLVGIDGVKLSGGQRQRLAIAQAVLKNPPLLLLDEATSALDSFSELHIQAALKELFRSRTSIVIAHRLSTVTDADQIIVIDQGRIQEQGSHKDLIARDGLYKKLCDAQVEGFINWEALADQPEGPA